MFRVNYLNFKRLSWANKKIFVILHRFKLKIGISMRAY